MKSIRARLDRWSNELGDTYALGLCRVCLGVLFLRYAVLSARTLVVQGFFGDAFHLPMLPPALVPSRGIYLLLLTILLALSMAIIVGRLARVALFGSSIIACYLALCDRLELHNNRWALLCFAFLLAFSPCDHRLVIRRQSDEGRARVGPLWAQRLMQLQLSVIYLASGGGKLLDADWRGGLVLADRLERYRYQAPRAFDGIIDWLAQPEIASSLAKVAIATELFLAVGLLLPKTRIAALWLGVVFHLSIEISSKVEVFTWLTFAIYALYATPDYRARKLYYDASRSSGRAIAFIVRALDWLARFEINSSGVSEARERPLLVVVERDGREIVGRSALGAIARCLPALFLLWPILALLTPKMGRPSRAAVE